MSIGIRLFMVTPLEVVSCLSWNVRKRSSVKITGRAHEKRAKALHRRTEGCHSEAALVGESAGFRSVRGTWAAANSVLPLAKRVLRERCGCLSRQEPAG